MAAEVAAEKFGCWRSVLGFLLLIDVVIRAFSSHLGHGCFFFLFFLFFFSFFWVENFLKKWHFVCLQSLNKCHFWLFQIKLFFKKRRVGRQIRKYSAWFGELGLKCKPLLIYKLLAIYWKPNRTSAWFLHLWRYALRQSGIVNIISKNYRVALYWHFIES